jgi:BirA family biotin operon repressor/biotin-[acetyl-CoA-carboxylase] ligase
MADLKKKTAPFSKKYPRSKRSRYASNSSDFDPFTASNHFIVDMEAGIKGTIGRRVLFYEKVGSTNTVAAELAQEGAREGTVVLADSQEKGRGRIGRCWVSPPNVNIYMSIILRPEIKPREGQLITIMAAIGCALALRRVTGLNVTIRWPNDLMVSDKKIGGILTETKTYSRRILFAVVGIGINVNIEVDAFPDDIKKTATSVKNETGMPYSRKTIIIEVLNEIDHWYRTLKEMGKGILLSEWRKLASDYGREVKVTDGRVTLRGLVESIDDEGRLVLRLQSGELKRIRAGDVTILR